MSSRFPDAETLRAALASAVRAPSVHNSQPWRWRVGAHSLHLYADPSRLGAPPACGGLPATVPDRRDLLLSCGATLHHCVAALAGLGWKTTVHRMPDPARPEYLEITETRDALREELFDGCEYPQVLIRVGWVAEDAAPLPATPRRNLRV